MWKSKTATIAGGLDVITGLQWKEFFARCLATLFGLISKLISCCISILGHLSSRQLMIWPPPSGVTIRGSAHVDRDWPYPLRRPGHRNRQVHQEGGALMDITISVNGKEYRLQNDTAQVFRFRQLPRADHAYYEDSNTCFYIFERQDLLAIMERSGARTIIDDYPGDDDMTAYVNFTMDNLNPLDDDLGEL